MPQLGVTDRLIAALAEMAERNGVSREQVLGEAVGLLLVADRAHHLHQEKVWLRKPGSKETELPIQMHRPKGIPF